jgi:hypothetical protein
LKKLFDIDLGEKLLVEAFFIWVFGVWNEVLSPSWNFDCLINWGFLMVNCDLRYEFHSYEFSHIVTKKVGLLCRQYEGDCWIFSEQWVNGRSNKRLGWHLWRVFNVRSTQFNLCNCCKRFRLSLVVKEG